jgi:acyl carrier protein
MNTSIQQELSSFIAKEILNQPDRHIRPDEPLISSGLVDSFSLVDLSLHVQEVYNVQIDDTELTADTFDTVDQLAALVQSRLG